MSKRLWAPWIAVVAILVGTLPAAAVTLSRDGQPAVSIVLADYLSKVVGATFEVVSESDKRQPKPAIYVGPTSFAQQHGLDPESWGAEEWAIRTVGDDLVLVGGRPRGTLYAVYRFLEKEQGSESGPLLHFLNHVADAVRDEHPQIRINTLAYQMTEEPPQTAVPLRRDSMVTGHDQNWTPARKKATWALDARAGRHVKCSA